MRAPTLATRVECLMLLDGDHCHYCRRPWGDGEKVYIGFDRKRRLALLGKCCGARLESIIGLSIYSTRADP